MTAQKHVIVIGAGIVGASAAWHLAVAGARVTVVDAAGTGGVATPNSFAWINASWGNPEPYFRLRMRSMAEWRRLADAVPRIPLSWCGGLCWDLPPVELEVFAAGHSAWGYGIRRVDTAEIARIEPRLAAPPDFALHVAGEGAVEPVLACRALLDDAARRGATVRTELPVTALLREGDRVVGIDLGPERLVADEVVLAAGAGAPGLAASAGFDIRLDTPPGLLVHSRPHGRLLNGLVLAEQAHVRQTADGRVVAGADFGGAEPGRDPLDTAHALFAEVKAMLTGAETLEFDVHTIGYRPTPIDGFPMIGRPAGLNGVYLAVMHSGVTLAPAVGLFTAEEILSGRRDPLLAPYGADRFG